MQKNNTGASFADYMTQREKKKSDLLAELSRAKTPARQEEALQKIKSLSPAPFQQNLRRDVPPGINPDEYDPQTGGIDTAKNNKLVSGEIQRKSPVSTWQNPDEVDPYTGGLQESGTRNLVDPSVETVDQINKAIKNGDRKALQTSLWRYSNLGPSYAAAMDYNDRFQLRLVNGETHVIDKDNETEEEFNNAGDALKYIDRTLFGFTKEQLSSFGYSETKLTDSFMDGLNQTIESFIINDSIDENIINNRIAMFIAQICVESGYGKLTVEIGNKEYFNKTYGPAGTKESKMGDIVNQETGLRRYCGSGYIQLSTRPNYAKFAEAMKDPEILEQGVYYVAENYPWEAAGWWWGKNGMNDYIDNGATIAQVSRRVNGGTNGLQERINAYNMIMDYLE